MFFRNPIDDPRTNRLNYSRRNRPRLTRSQFRFWLGENRRARQSGQPPPMVILPYPRLVSEVPAANTIPRAFRTTAQLLREDLGRLHVEWIRESRAACRLIGAERLRLRVRLW